MILKRDDAEIYYEVRGEGPDVVLVHPFPSCGEFWAPMAERLEARFRVVIPDLRGHGRSGAGEGSATMRKHAQDLAALCDETGVGRAAFVGCSIGGYVLFEFWREFRERVRALVLCDTKAGADTDEARTNRLRIAEDVLLKGPETVIDGMMEKLLGESTRRNRLDVARAARETMARSTAQGIAAVQRGMAERPDSTNTLMTIDVPALVAGGEEDTLAPREELEKMARGIHGAELKMVAQAGHYAPFEQAEEVARMVRQFLEKNAGRA